MIISIINQKGGVAKTTTTFNLAHNLADEGYKVLEIDIDPQGSLTIANGIEPNNLEKSIYDVLCENANIKDVIHEVNDNLSICVSNLDLSAAEINMVNLMARELLLKKAIKSVKDDYDYILIDCPPNLGILTINALCASEKVLIPVATYYLSLRGLDLLMGTVGRVRENLNEEIEVLEKNHNLLGVISNSVKVKDSILASTSLQNFEASHKTAKEYKEISDKIIKLRK